MQDHTIWKKKATIWDHLSIVLKWKKLVIIFMLIMAVSAVTYSLLIDTWFFSDARLLPPPAETMGLAGLVPDLGMGLLGGVGALGSEFKLAAAILDSRRMMDKVINRFKWQEIHNFKYREDVYKFYHKNVIWEIVEEGTIYIRVNDTDAQRTADVVNYIVDELLTEYNAVTVAQAKTQREFIEKRLNQNLEELKQAEADMQAFQERTGAIAVEDQLRSTVDAIATLKGEQILAEVELEVLAKTLPPTSSMVIQARERAETLTDKVDELMRQSDAEGPSALIGLDVAPEVGIEYFRLFREIELQAKILEFMLPQYEQARLSELREKGDLYILDAGEVPEKKYKPKRAFMVIGWMFISFIILYGYIIFVEWMRYLKSSDQESYSTVSGVINGLKLKNLFNFKEDSPRS